MRGKGTTVLRFSKDGGARGTAPAPDGFGLFGLRDGRRLRQAKMAAGTASNRARWVGVDLKPVFVSLLGLLAKIKV